LADEIQNQETVVSERTSLTYDANDLDLISAIDKAIQESKTVKTDIDKQGEINRSFWRRGSAVDEKIHPKRSKAKVNRIFTDVETLIPLVTSEVPEGMVVGTDDNTLKCNIQESLKIEYESGYKMKQKFQRLMRHWMIYKIGILKYRWDNAKDKFVTENVLPKRMGFDKRATSWENCEYAWEELEDPLEKVIEKFPKKKKDLELKFGKDNPKSKVHYFEFWGGTGKWVVWRLQEIILDKLLNMNFDYDNPENNIFKEPEFPYLTLNVFNLGDDTSLYDETSFIEESIPAQEGVNSLERMFINLNEGRQRVWAFDTTAVNQKVQQQLVDETGDLAVAYNGKFNPQAVHQVQAGIPDASFQANLQHLLSEIDNIFGVHPATKGVQQAQEQETAKGRQLLLSADIGRLDPIVSNLEDVCEKWYNAYLHMNKVFADKPANITDGKQSYELDFSQIPSGVRIIVQKGTTLPTDEKTKHDQALALSKGGLMSPKDLYEEIGYPNPEEFFNDLVQWLTMTGKIVQPAPMGQTPPGGTPPQPGAQPPGGMPSGAPQGQPGGDPHAQQLQKLQQMLQSPQFQQLPPEEQKKYLEQAKQIMAQIQGQPGQPQAQPAPAQQ
jgi:hypothetical protein